LLGSEKFMRDYYRHALALYIQAETVLARIAEKEKRPSRWFGWQRAVSLAEPFSIKAGKLQLDQDSSYFVANPLLIFDAFALAQAANVPFNRGLHEAIRENLGLINREFRISFEAANAFLRLLR